MTAEPVRLDFGRFWRASDLDLLPEGRFEIVEGRLVVVPRPAIRHQWVIMKLQDLLQQQLPEGLLCIQEIDLVLHEHLTREPDLVVIDEAIVDDQVRATADQAHLVIEVVSPDSPSVDRRDKPIEYAAAGIPAYWRIETRPAVAIIEYRLVADRYVEARPAVAEFETDFPWPVSLDIADLDPRRRQRRG